MFAGILRGLLIGFAIVAPIGMQNLFLFNNALTQKLRKALVNSGFIWLADATFEFVAFFGMGALIASNVWVKNLAMLIGGALVVYLATGILRGARSFKVETEARQMSTARVILASFTIVWANPQAIIDGSVMLGALRGTMDSLMASYFIIGVLIATFIWFFGITLVMGLLKSRLPQRFLLWVNIISGLIMFGYGIYLLVHVLTILI